MAGHEHRAGAPLGWAAFFLRRFVGPVLASTALIGGAIFLYAWLIGGEAESEPFVYLHAFAFLAVALSVPLLVIGIPAGYLVARLGWSYWSSFPGLVGIGFAAGFLAPLARGPGGGYLILVAALLLGVCGALVAAVWAAFNADLFRRGNGA